MKTLASNSNVMRTKKILLTSIVMSIFFSFFSMSSASAENIEIIASNNILCDDKGPENCLPAYRYDDFRVEGKFQKILNIEIGFFSTVSSFIFSAANLIWSITLVFIKAGLSIDLISNMAPTINSGISVFSDSNLVKTIILFGLLMVIYINIIKPAFGIGRNNSPFGVKSFRAFVQPFFIIALISVIGLSSLSANAKYESLDEAGKKNYKASDSKGTIPWFVSSVSGFVGKMSTDIAETLTAKDTLTGVQKDNSANSVTAFGDKDDLLSCEKYNYNLYAMFDKSIAENNPNDKSIATLNTLSKLWENTFYKSYGAAIFGPPADDGSNIGGRITCHYLETYNRIPAAERAQIINASGTAIVSAKSKAIQVHEKEEDSLRGWMAFALCQNKNGVVDFNKILFNNTEYLKDKNVCINAFKIAGDDNGLSTNVFDIDNQPVYKNEAANSFVANLKDDGPSKVILGFIALLVSLVFLWTFGWLSLGLIFVNITSVIILTISPIILAASLFVTGERRSKVFSLFKLLGTAIVTKFLFTIIIVLLLKISAIGSNMVQFLPLGNGFISSIVIGFMPIVALLAVRKILNAFSLGDILTAGGALAFSLNTQNQALSQIDKKGTLADKLKTAGSKIPKKDSIDKRLDKFDRIGPQIMAKKALSKKFRKEQKTLVSDEKKEIRDKRETKRLARDPENIMTDRLAEKMNSMGVSLDSVGDKAREVGDSVKRSGAAVLGGGVLLGSGGAALGAGIIAGSAGYKSLKNKKDNSGQEAPIFNPEGLETTKHKVGNNTKIAANTRENNRIRNKKKQNLSTSSLESYDAEMYNGAVLEYNRKAYGEDFDGFTSRGQLEATAENYASANGYENSDILFSHASGLIIPNPKANRENLSNDQLKHWAYYLDKNTIERKGEENDSDYVNRLFSAAHQRGLVSSDGQAFNPLEHFDIDVNSPQMLDFVKSVSDIDDKAFKISSKNSSLEKQITDGVLNSFKVSGFTAQQYGSSLSVIKQENDKLISQILSTSKEASLAFSGKVTDIANISGEIKKIKFRIEHEDISNETKESLRNEILKQSDELVNIAQVQRNELFREITDNIARSIGTDPNYISSSASEIKERIIESIKEIEPMFEQIEKSIYDEINTGESTLVIDLANIHKELKKRNAELISEITNVSKDIEKDISISFDKAGDLTKVKDLYQFIDDYGSSRFPIERRR